MNECLYEGCNRVRKYREYCHGHHKQQRDGEELRGIRAWVPERCKEKEEEGMVVRYCSRCETYKPRSEFRPLNAGEEKLGGRCKVCARLTARWSSFQITEEDYLRLKDLQGNRCALCGATEPGAADWHIDHDHACCPGRGKSCGECVRGLLCRYCNSTIVPYYEKLPGELRNWPHMESYLARRISRAR